MLCIPGDRMSFQKCLLAREMLIDQGNFWIYCVNRLGKCNILSWNETHFSMNVTDCYLRCLPGDYYNIIFMGLHIVSS